MRRIDPTRGISIIDTTRNTPIPQHPEELWESQEHKWNYQLLIRDIGCNGEYVNTDIIASCVVSGDEVLPANANGGAWMHELLNWTDEAVSRLVLHVEWMKQSAG